MADWSGFTEADLRNLKNQSKQKSVADAKVKPGPSDGGVSRASSNRGRVRVPQSRGKLGARVQFADPLETPAPISPSQMLSKPPEPVPQKESHGPELKSALKTADLKDPSTPEVSKQRADAAKPLNDLQEDMEKKKEMQELNEEEGMSRELSNLEKFQQQQKVMEEQNKKKKELLAQAIQERKKKAKAEASRLLHIQQELDKLDMMLNADVSIIRDRIEEASREFLEAQKRFEKAEKEYVDAKLDLFKKQEEKESLTEHLCAIIHQNELRKGKKLLELMEKLDMEATEDEVAALQNSLPSAVFLETVKIPKSPTQTDKPVTSQPAPTDVNSTEPGDESSKKQQASHTDRQGEPNNEPSQPKVNNSPDNNEQGKDTSNVSNDTVVSETMSLDQNKNISEQSERKPKTVEIEDKVDNKTNNKRDTNTDLAIESQTPTNNNVTAENKVS